MNMIDLSTPPVLNLSEKMIHQDEIVRAFWRVEMILKQKCYLTDEVIKTLCAVVDARDSSLQALKRNHVEEFTSLAFG